MVFRYVLTAQTCDIQANTGRCSVLKTISINLMGDRHSVFETSFWPSTFIDDVLIRRRRDRYPKVSRHHTRNV